MRVEEFPWDSVRRRRGRGGGFTSVQVLIVAKREDVAKGPKFLFILDCQRLATDPLSVSDPRSVGLHTHLNPPPPRTPHPHNGALLSLRVVPGPRGLVRLQVGPTRAEGTGGATRRRQATGDKTQAPEEKECPTKTLLPVDMALLVWRGRGPEATELTDLRVSPDRSRGHSPFTGGPLPGPRPPAAGARATVGAVCKGREERIPGR